MKLFVLALAIALSLAAPARADEHALGFAAGATTGAGFSYRHLHDSGYGLQATGFFGQTGSYPQATYGLQGIVPFQRSDWGRLYLVGGASRWNDFWMYGAGPGIQIGAGRGVSLAIELTLTVFGNSPSVPLPMPNLSLMYTF